MGREAEAGASGEVEGTGWLGLWREGEGGGGGGGHGVRAPAPSSICAAAAAKTCPPAGSARLAYPPGSETTGSLAASVNGARWGGRGFTKLQCKSEITGSFPANHWGSLHFAKQHPNHFTVIHFSLFLLYY